MSGRTCETGSSSSRTRREHPQQMVTSIFSFFVCWLSFAGIPVSILGDSVYRFPLTDYIGTAEVVWGGASGYDGLGYVTSFTSHPSLPYQSLYFNGTSSSFAELRIGQNYTVENDWSFNMFVYSKAPHRGTIFDLVYDGVEPLKHPLTSKKIKLELNETEIILTMLGPDGQDHGCAVLGTIFTAEAWIPLSVVHDEGKGDVIIQTFDNEFYISKNFQNNRNNVKLPQPAKVKLGDTYDTSFPFEGSIVCFALYDTQVISTSFSATLNECHPDNWPHTPDSIDILNRPTTPPVTSSSTTTLATAATTTTSTSTTATASSCPEYYGYYIVVAVDTRPSVAAILVGAETESNRQCGQLCLVEQACKSFTYNGATRFCFLFDKIHDANTEIAAGTHYYKRRDIC